LERILGLINFAWVSNPLERIYLKRVNCFLRDLARNCLRDIPVPLSRDLRKAFVLAQAESLKLANSLANFSLSGSIHGCFQCRVGLPHKRSAAKLRSGKLP